MSIQNIQKDVTRRSLLKTLAGSAALGSPSLSPLRAFAAPAPARPFLWGTATSAYQVEGNNTNTDIWALEHLPIGLFKQRSGDACDHYHRFREDIALLASLGFNSYRFSIEWARIEPAKGQVSRAELEHYREMAELCRAHNMQPWITLHHFSSPLWFAESGGWEQPEAPALFAAYCKTVAQHLGSLAAGYFTINEINLPPELLRYKTTVFPQQDAILQAIRKLTGKPAFSTFLIGDQTRVGSALIEAHKQAVQQIKAVARDVPVGMTLALRDHQSLRGGESNLQAIEATDYLPYFDLARSDDFIAIQCYSRVRVSDRGELPPDKAAEHTQTDWEFYPQALEDSIRFTAAHYPKPIYVSENGLATSDDTRRIAYLQAALAGLRRCQADGLDVRGYFHWSAFDNFEWMSGYTPHFGLIAVDPATFARTPKPSAHYLGSIAKAARS